MRIRQFVNKVNHKLAPNLIFYSSSQTQIINNIEVRCLIYLKPNRTQLQRIPRKEETDACFYRIANSVPDHAFVA